MSIKNSNHFILIFIFLAIVAVMFAVTARRISVSHPEPEPAPIRAEILRPEKLVYFVEPSITPPTPEPVQTPEPTYTEDDLFVMAVIIYQEAGGDACSDETRIMVGNVVMNRVADSRFPDTIREVALGHRQYGTLYKTGVKFPERASNPGEKHAVERAYEIAKRVLEGERLLDSDVIWQAEFKQGKGTRFYQDGIYFCY